MINKPTPYSEQLRIVISIAGGILVFILVQTGAHYHIGKYNFPNWLEVVFNIISLIFSVASGVGFFGFFAVSSNKKKADM